MAQDHRRVRRQSAPMARMDAARPQIHDKIEMIRTAGAGGDEVVAVGLRDSASQGVEERSVVVCRIFCRCQVLRLPCGTGQKNYAKAWCDNLQPEIRQRSASK